MSSTQYGGAGDDFPVRCGTSIPYGKSVGRYESITRNRSYMKAWNTPKIVEYRADSQERQKNVDPTSQHRLVRRTEDTPPPEGSVTKSQDDKTGRSTSISEQESSRGEKVRQAWARKTSEEKAASAEKKRQAWAQKPSEQKVAAVEKQLQTKAQKTPEEKAATEEKQRRTMAQKTSKEKAAFAEKQRQFNAQRTPEEKAAISETMRRTKAQWTPEQKAALSEKLRQAKKTNGSRTEGGDCRDPTSDSRAKDSETEGGYG